MHVGEIDELQKDKNYKDVSLIQLPRAKRIKKDHAVQTRNCRGGRP